MSEVLLNHYISILKCLFKFAHLAADCILNSTERQNINLLEALNLDENKITSLLKYFLTYKQGNKLVFLDRFIHNLSKYLDERSKNKTILSNLKEEDTEQTYVVLEFTIDNGRIDLFIKFKDFVIAIENKVGADLTGDQIGRYYEYLQKTFKNFLLVLLCDDEKRYEWSKKWLLENVKFYNPDNYLIVTYEQFIVPWLKECKEICNNGKIKFYLQEFEDFLRKKFYIMEEKVQEITNEITKFLREEYDKNKNFWQAIQIFQISIYNFLRELYDICAKEFTKDLINLAHEMFGKDYSITGQLDCNKYSRLSIYKDEWSIKGEPFFGIGIEAVEEYLSAFKIGIWIDPKSEHYETFKEKYSYNIQQIKQYIPEHRNDQWWISYKYISLRDFIEQKVEIRPEKDINSFLASPIFIEFCHNEQAYESVKKEISKLLTIYKNYIDSMYASI